MKLPIHFGLDESKFPERPGPVRAKTQAFSSMVPGDPSTYVYDDEGAYYKQYAASFYGVTKKKGGWDCMRHWEIVAAGCVPYFEKLDECPPGILTRFPKALVWEAMHLPGVDGSRRTIDFDQFPLARYEELRDAIFAAVKEVGTCRAVAQYLLASVGMPFPKRVLFLSSDPSPDYQRCTLLTGLKRALGGAAVSASVHVPHLYADYPAEAARRLYGQGFSYSRVLPAESAGADATDSLDGVEGYDLVVYGSVHRALPVHEKVQQLYPSERIVYVCGEDEHGTAIIPDDCASAVPAGSWLFVRELV
jgi:hypothetical protein